MYKYWKTSEVKYLKENINLDLSVISNTLGRSKSSVINFMHKNNIHNKRTWTDRDVKYVLKNSHKTYKMFAKHFSVTKTAFAQFINSKNIKLKAIRL